jgi:hypothetical protein
VTSLALTVIIPVVILTWFSGDDRLGAERAFVLALLFPLTYAVVELVRSRRIGFNPIIGVVSVLLTGGIGLLKLDPQWVAFKEAAVPLALALAILVSSWIGRPLARLFLDKVLDRPRVDAALAARGTAEEYERKTSVAAYLLTSAFLLSAVLNFTLAKIVVTSEAGTEAFNQELGRMTALSFPVITIPVMLTLIGTMVYIVRTVTNLTGLSMEHVLRQSGANSRDDQPMTTPEGEPS